jgi:alkylhydroperoxidase/carboxymuconolactone decarboxylase family protein YurZ
MASGEGMDWSSNTAVSSSSGEPYHTVLLEMESSVLRLNSICAALGHTKELAGHVRGALNNGLTEIEIREAVLHIMGYCGFPVGLEA